MAKVNSKDTLIYGALPLSDLDQQALELISKINASGRVEITKIGCGDDSPVLLFGSGGSIGHESVIGYLEDVLDFCTAPLA